MEENKAVDNLDIDLKYQKSDGAYLLDSSQPNVNQNHKITSQKYTPHTSTRYLNVVIGSNGKAQKLDAQGELVDVNQDLPELYVNKANCCGCTACFAICPVHAIFMRPDEEGFLYPIVDAKKCIRCYKCLSVCVFKVEQGKSDS